MMYEATNSGQPTGPPADLHAKESSPDGTSLIAGCGPLPSAQLPGDGSGLPSSGSSNAPAVRAAGVEAEWWRELPLSLDTFTSALEMNQELGGRICNATTSPSTALFCATEPCAHTRALCTQGTL